MIPSHGYEVPPVDFSLECSYFRSSVFLCLQHGAICWTGIPAMIKDIRTRYESIYCGALFVDKQLHQFKQKETSPHYNSPTTPISQTSTARVQEQNPYMQHTYINPPPFHPPLSPPPFTSPLQSISPKPPPAPPVSSATCYTASNTDSFCESAVRPCPSADTVSPSR